MRHNLHDGLGRLYHAWGRLGTLAGTLGDSRKLSVTAGDAPRRFSRVATGNRTSCQARMRWETNSSDKQLQQTGLAPASLHEKSIGSRAAALPILNDDRRASMAEWHEVILHGEAEGAGVLLNGRHERVGRTRLEIGHRRLRRSHRRCDDRLRDPALLALDGESAQDFPIAQRSFERLGECGVLSCALRDDLVEKVGLVLDGCSPQTGLLVTCLYATAYRIGPIKRSGRQCAFVPRLSQSASRLCARSMADFGVFCVFFLKACSESRIRPLDPTDANRTR